jgi:hypothetical protein
MRQNGTFNWLTFNFSLRSRTEYSFSTRYSPFPETLARSFSCNGMLNLKFDILSQVRCLLMNLWHTFWRLCHQFNLTRKIQWTTTRVKNVVWKLRLVRCRAAAFIRRLDIYANIPKMSKKLGLKKRTNFFEVIRNNFLKTVKTSQNRQHHFNQWNQIVNF